jgi:membrane-associated protease RseP (regulator of RpoE activity)
MQDRNGRVEMRGENVGTINCPSCGATLVAGLRFCRMCGYRLGEGVEEYVPTQLLDPKAAPTATAQPSATDPFAPRQTWGAGPMQPMQPLGTNSLKRQSDSSLSRLASACNPKRAGWWTWMILAFVMLTVMGGVFSGVRRNRNVVRGGGQGSGAPVSSLMVEADEYDTPDGGGAMIRGLAGPDTSLERAGLVGGDTIMSFDGKPVRDGDAMKKLIADTPIGKTVEIVYIHDNETKKTLLTIVGREGFHGMDSLRQRPGGRGVLDIDFDDGDRVRVPNTNIYGIELDGVVRNGPADIAGLKEGDIVVGLDGKPIRTAGDLRYRAGAATPGSTVNIDIVRDGQQITIPVKMGRQR